MDVVFVGVCRDEASNALSLFPSDDVGNDSVGVVVDLRAIQGHIASRMGRDGAESMESLVENHRAGPKAAGTPIVRRVRGPKGAPRRRGLKDRPEPRLRRIRVDSTAKLRRFQVSTRGRPKERLALGGHETSAG